MDIDRKLFAGKCYFVIGGVFVLAGLSGLIFSLQWGYIFPIVFGLVALWFGARSFGGGKRELAKFEAENGVGAGVQTPIRELNKG
jgi:hypothetical protein